MRTFGVAALAACAVGLTPPVQAVDITPAVDFTLWDVGFENRPFTLGYSFSLTGSVTVNALGYWNDLLGNNHRVGIWDSGGTLLTSTTVLGTDSLLSNFIWGAITPVTLRTGDYVVAGEFLGDQASIPVFVSGINSIPQYSYVRDLQLLGAGLNFPTNSYGVSEYGDNGIFLVSFSVTNAVPEPETWAMLLLGLCGIGIALRRSQNEVSPRRAQSLLRRINTSGAMRFAYCTLHGLG